MDAPSPIPPSVVRLVLACERAKADGERLRADSTALLAYLRRLRAQQAARLARAAAMSRGTRASDAGPEDV